MKEAVIFLHGKERIYLAEDLDRIIKADEFSISGDEENLRYRLVCGSCNSPAIFVSKKNGQKYFRHPARKTKELKERDENCEKRSNSISPKTIRTYNRIVEQTTMGEYCDNFKRIYSNLYKFDEISYQEWNFLFENKRVKSLFSLIKKEGNKNISKIKSRYASELSKRQKYVNQDYEERFQFFYKFHSELDDPEKNLDFPHPVIVDILNNPVNIIIERLASTLLLHDLKDPNVSYLDENTKKLFPLIIKDQLRELPRIYQMLLHENSQEIREWCLFVYLIIAYTEDFKKGSKNHLYNTPVDKIYTFEGLKFFLGELLFYITNKEKLIPKIGEETYKNNYSFVLEKVKDIYKHDILESYLFMSRVIAETIQGKSIDTWYKAVNKANQTRIENEKENSGYIYIAVNNDVYRDGKGMDDRVKIGKTKKIQKRREDYKTFSAEGWLFLNVWHVTNRHRAENFIHSRLKRFQIRKGAGKEFFELSSSVATQKVEKLVMEFQSKNGFFTSEITSSGKGF